MTDLNGLLLEVSWALGIYVRKKRNRWFENMLKIKLNHMWVI
jgi:hypothetical protein